MHTSQIDNTIPENIQKRYGLLVGRSSKFMRQKPAVTKHSDEAFFTPADNVVLEELFGDINKEASRVHDNTPKKNRQPLSLLCDLNDAKSEHFQPNSFLQLGL